MDIVDLKAIIDGDPTLQNMTDEEVAEILNGRTVTFSAPTFVTKTSIYKALGFTTGLQIMGTFQQMSQNQDAAIALQFSEILDLLRVDGGGLDIALDETKNVIDSLVVAGVLTVGNATILKNLGNKVQPLWQQFGRLFDYADVLKARSING